MWAIGFRTKKLHVWYACGHREECALWTNDVKCAITFSSKDDAMRHKAKWQLNESYKLEIFKC